MYYYRDVTITLTVLLSGSPGGIDDLLVPCLVYIKVYKKYYICTRTSSFLHESNIEITKKVTVTNNTGLYNELMVP